MSGEFNMDMPQADIQKIAVNAEKSTLMESIADNDKLLERLRESKKIIAEASLEVIDAMMVNHDAKGEYLKNLRNYRMSIAREVGDIARDMARIKEFASDKNIQGAIWNIKQLIEVCEKLVALEKTGALSRVLGDPAKSMETNQAKGEI